MMWNLQNYPATVLNERKWHFRWVKTYIFSGGHDPQPSRIYAPGCHYSLRSIYSVYRWCCCFWCLFNWTIFQRSSLEACRRLQTFHSPTCPHIFCIQPRHNPAVSRIINSMPTPQFLETFSQPHPKIRHRHSSTFWVVLRADELTKIKT